MSWQENPVMEWSETGSTWTKISDHGRSPLSISVERIETKQRMANGRMRRYTVGKKRTFSCSWDNLPDKKTDFLANGEAGTWMENFHDRVDGPFLIRLRSGSDKGKTSGFDSYLVVITDFSKEVVKRGPNFDLWSLDLTLEEV